MIAHALTIIVNELNQHFADAYGIAAPQAQLGNLAEGFTTNAGNGGLERDFLYL